MKIKKGASLILAIILSYQTLAQHLIETVHNPNFQTRFEYINGIFEWMRWEMLGEEIIVGFNIKSIDDQRTYKAATYPKNIYEILNGENANPSEELLYFSVGKMLIHDTLYLDNKTIHRFKDIIINENEWERYHSLEFQTVLNSFVSKDSFFIKNERSLYYYFDRHYYPTLDLSTGFKLFLKFNFGDNIVVSGRKGKALIYRFNSKGLLINISEQ